MPNYPNVFAAGDAAAIERGGQPLRKAVNFAYYGGRRAARTSRGGGAAADPAVPPGGPGLGGAVPRDEHRPAAGGLWIRGRLGVRLHHLMCGVRNYSFANFAGCLAAGAEPELGANA
jgi:hypothetical protein